MSPNYLPSKGFALVVVLAILVVTTIFVVGFAAVMRSERQASANFEERERAQALAEGMLSRIMAQWSSPLLGDGTHLKPFSDPEYYDTEARLPRNNSPYLADPRASGNEALRSIYGIVPSAEISPVNHLVALSAPESGEGAAAYTPLDWAYLDLPGDAFLPKNADGTPVAPKWIDYYETLPDGSRSANPSGQVAYAIWEESGKFDINIIGADTRINGLAPHDLGMEKSLASGEHILARINGPNGRRDRSNFSLRSIRSSTDPANQTGDDQWFFALGELIQQNLANPEELVGFTTWSRDFDVRPEWDGNRSPDRARGFLRSYINNPKLFELFQHSEAGPELVQDTLDEQRLLDALPDSLQNSPDQDDWMEVMRLLAVIRRALPPYTKSAAINGAPISVDSWSDHDVWGIALNLIQASSTPSDKNLIAFDQKSFPQGSYADEHNRYGIRLSPFLVEVAIRISKVSATEYKLTEFIKIWNPYDFELQSPDGTPIDYYVGELTGIEWPKGQHGIWKISDPRSRKKVPAPPPGEFAVVELESRLITTAELNDQSPRIPAVPGQPKGLMIRHRPFIADSDYFRFTDASANDVLAKSHIMVAPASNADSSQMRSYIHSSELPQLIGESAWYSWQIDDPRMGAFTQHHNLSGASFDAFVNNPNSNRNSDQSAYPIARYTWQGYLNRHSLPTLENDNFFAGKSFLVNGKSVSGFNINFGQNFPGGIDSQVQFESAMATFALPGRPMANLGELGAVFANRPWRTLNLGATIAPGDATIPVSSDFRHGPMAFLDYFSTIGTETDDRTLNYMAPGAFTAATAPTAPANSNQRKRGMRWLFESVEDEPGNAQIPSGNLRPIRGRINLNTADPTILATLLKAPYRLPASIALRARGDLTPTQVATHNGLTELEITIREDDANALAEGVVSIRPLRALSDLSRLDSGDLPLLKSLHEKYPASVVNAMIGRLAQFGTVRQQIYTIDLVARSFNRGAQERGQRVITAEAWLRARVYCDTFSRQCFVESMETQ